MSLNKQQTPKAKKLLDELCKTGNLDAEQVYPLFDSENETEFVCAFLEETNFLKIIPSGNGTRIIRLISTENTCNCVKNNLLDKEFRDTKKLAFTADVKLIGLIISVILNICLIGNLFLKSDDSLKLKPNLDTCVTRESKLNHVVDSITIENQKLQNQVKNLEK